MHYTDFLQADKKTQFKAAICRNNMQTPYWRFQLHKAIEELDINALGFTNDRKEWQKIFDFLTNPVGMEFTTQRQAQSMSGFGNQWTTWRIDEVTETTFGNGGHLVAHCSRVHTEEIEAPNDCTFLIYKIYADLIDRYSYRGVAVV